MNGLKPHQPAHVRDLLGVLQHHRAALDGSDTGTGKTFTALAVARELEVVPLVIAPKSTLAAWREAAAHMGIEIDAVGYEKVRSKNSPYGRLEKCGNGSRWVWNSGFAFGIFDEVDRCGGMSTISSKLLIAATRQFNKLLLLSATAADKPQQLKALGYALGLFELREFKWWTFKHGCEPGVYGGIVLSDEPFQVERGILKIHRAVYPAHGARMRKDLIPDFPKTHIAPLLLEDADGKATKLAAEIFPLWKRYASEVEADEAQNRDVKQEIRAARAEGDEGRAEELKGEKVSPLKILTRKQQALELLMVPDLVERAVSFAETSKVLIFFNYSESIDAARKLLEEALGCLVPVFDGRPQFKPVRDFWLKEFQKNLHPVFLLNTKAGGIGVNAHDPEGRVERTSLIAPQYNPRILKQIFGRPQRSGGAFSQQFWAYFIGTKQEEIAHTVFAKADRIDLLNDGQLSFAE